MKRSFEEALWEEFDNDEAMLGEDTHNPFSQVPLDLYHLIPGFLDRREREITDLRELTEAGNYVAIKDIAHKLKGTGTGYGFTTITDIGAALETAALAGDERQTKMLVEQLSAIVNELVTNWKVRRANMI